MSGDDKPKRNIFKWLSIIFWIVIFAALVLVVLSLVPGKRPGQSVLSEIFAPRAPLISVSEFNFDVGRDRVFAHMKGSIAAVGTLGLQVLGHDGYETLKHSFRADCPAIAENNGLFIAYDIGGTSVQVFDASNILSSIEANGIIVSASINKNGWFCVVTQERGGYRGTVSVYNANGAQVYKVNIGTGFVLSAKLSPDNKNLAILNMAETGSRITYYIGIDSHKDEPDELFEFDNELIIDIDFTENSGILAVSTQAVHTIEVSKNKSITVLYRFEHKRLAGYTYTDKFIALHLYDYGIGYTGKIITINYSGTVLGEIDSNLEIVSMDSDLNTLVILRNDGIVFYSENLVEYPASETDSSSTTAERILSLGEDMALVANDHFAVVIRRGEDN